MTGAKQSKYLTAVIGVSASVLAVIGLTLQLKRPSVHTNFFTLIAIALSGDVLWLSSAHRKDRRWVWWTLLLFANIPLVVALAREASLR